MRELLADEWPNLIRAGMRSVKRRREQHLQRGCAYPERAPEPKNIARRIELLLRRRKVRIGGWPRNASTMVDVLADHGQHW